MDLLIEKGDKRTYLSRYKVITTSFEESAPSVNRNNTQIQYRNGNVDFGGWNEAKTIDYVGYYRADDLEDEEYLRERIYALLSDPEGYYITQLKNDNDNGFERPGETSGDYFDKQVNRPSHKRFYVYASSLESELVGSYGGHVLYKISATFTTIKLPYGESVPRDLDVKPNVPYYGRNLLTGTADKIVTGTNAYALLSNETIDDLLTVFQGLEGQTVTISFDYEYSGFVAGSGDDRMGWEIQINADITSYHGTWYNPNNDSGSGRTSSTFVVPENITSISEAQGYIQFSGSGTGTLSNLKLEKGSVSTPLTPAPVDKVFSNGRQVYGRNLYVDTKNINNLALWFSNKNWTKQPDKYNGLAVMQTTGDWGGISQYVKVKTGDVYTFSLYARYTSGTGNSNMYWQLNTDLESGHARAQVSAVNKIVNLSDNWQRISTTAAITADGYIRPRIERSSNNSNVLQIAGMKLEMGTLATPYSPAPEDVM